MSESRSPGIIWERTEEEVFPQWEKRRSDAAEDAWIENNARKQEGGMEASEIRKECRMENHNERIN